MTYEKGSCAEFGPMDVFWFKSDSVKPFSRIRIKVIIIIIIIIVIIIIIIVIIIIIIIIITRRTCANLGRTLVIFLENVQILSKIQKEKPHTKQTKIQRSQRLRVKVSPRNRSGRQYLSK